MARLRREQLMVAQEMVARDMSVRQVARHLGDDESTMRYHLTKAADAPDDRRDCPSVLDAWHDRVTAVLARFSDPHVGGDSERRVEAAVVHGVLRREFGFTGSYLAVRRQLTRTSPALPVRAVRRVETPPGAQAQHDWFDTRVRLDGVLTPIHGLLGTLSHARTHFVWVSPVMDQLAWQSGHVALFCRYVGVPLWVLVDNLKTAIASGAGRPVLHASPTRSGSTARKMRRRSSAFLNRLVRATVSF